VPIRQDNNPILLISIFAHEERPIADVSRSDVGFSDREGRGVDFAVAAAVGRKTEINVDPLSLSLSLSLSLYLYLYLSIYLSISLVR